MDKYLFVKNRRYYYFDTFNSYKEALNTAKRMRRSFKSRWYVLKAESGFYPKIVFRLYLTNVWGLW